MGKKRRRSHNVESTILPTARLLPTKHDDASSHHHDSSRGSATPISGSFSEKNRSLETVSDATTATTTEASGSSTNLPVHEYKSELLESIMDPSHVTLVVAETGSGKSTQIPAYVLLQQAKSLHQQQQLPVCMAVTQPRRVAAMTLAARVAQEQCVPLGSQVGYRVRFDDCTHPTKTQLVYVTDGMLLREAMVDPLLSQYSVVFIDEAHERSLQTDILMGIVQRARQQRRRPQQQQQQSTISSPIHRPLKVVIMSATLDINLFEQYFDATRVIRIPGRQYNVQVLYTSQPVDDYVEATLSTLVQIHTHEPEGDVLAFLPGQEEIEDTASLLKRQLLDHDEHIQWTGDRVIKLDNSNSNRSSDDGGSSSSSQQLVNGVLICMLYAALPPSAQLAAFAPKPDGCIRKIILATNIAETSVTLPAIRYVIDCGKQKSRRVLSTGMEALQVETISQAQANQRKGRAGRVRDGVCFRLYTEHAFQHDLEATTVPDILRVNLAQVVLQLLGMGVTDPLSFEFITPPDPESIKRALKLLYALTAVDDAMTLTEYGRKLAKLPLDPVYGHLLLQSTAYSCLKEMLTAVSVLSSDHLLYRPHAGSGLGDESTAPSTKAALAHRRFVSHEGDLPTFLNVYQAWRQEAVYIPVGHRKSHQKQLRNANSGQAALLSHGDWCQRNFVSGRSLVRAFHIRQQLEALCARPVQQNGLGLEITQSCGQDRISFLKCVASGLFLQAASRIKMEAESNGKGGRSGLLQSTRGRYRTTLGNAAVSIHPTSSLFGRNPAPACVVYTELVSTKKTYIRGVTQIREEWLHEVAPNFYPKL